MAAIYPVISEFLQDGQREIAGKNLRPSCVTVRVQNLRRWRKRQEKTKNEKISAWWVLAERFADNFKGGKALLANWGAHITSAHYITHESHEYGPS